MNSRIDQAPAIAEFVLERIGHHRLEGCVGTYIDHLLPDELVAVFPHAPVEQFRRGVAIAVELIEIENAWGARP
jgi:hypothetical protein